MNQCQLFCEFHCTYAKDKLRKYVSKKQHVFYEPDKPANQDITFHIISDASDTAC